MKTLAVIDEMFFSFVRTEQFMTLSEDQRNEFVDRVENLRGQAKKMDE